MCKKISHLVAPLIVLIFFSLKEYKNLIHKSLYLINFVTKILRIPLLKFIVLIFFNYLNKKVFIIFNLFKVKHTFFNILFKYFICCYCKKKFK